MKFELGQVVMTRSINEEIAENSKFAFEVSQAFSRYQKADWGDSPAEDKQFNDEALKDGERILAAYKTSKGKIWIITEWDRSATTILFPSEY